MLSRQDKEMATIVFVKKKPKVSFCFILKHDCVHVHINQKSNRSSISLRNRTDYSYQVGRGTSSYNGFFTWYFNMPYF